MVYFNFEIINLPCSVEFADSEIFFAFEVISQNLHIGTHKNLQSISLLYLFFYLNSFEKSVCRICRKSSSFSSTPSIVKYFLLFEVISQI